MSVKTHFYVYLGHYFEKDPMLDLDLLEKKGLDSDYIEATSGRIVGKRLHATNDEAEDTVTLLIDPDIDDDSFMKAWVKMFNFPPKFYCIKDDW